MPENPLVNPKQSANKKIKNARKCTKDGFKFDSILEMTCYSYFKLFGFNFTLKPKFILQPKFSYNGKNIQAITFTFDFFLKDFHLLVDAKGWANDTAPLKIKMLKYHLSKTYNDPPEIVIIPKKTQIEPFCNKLLTIRDNRRKNN